jgi:thiamine pyrophosphate-dependent acetolactate synthase large subunit-like protein
MHSQYGESGFTGVAGFDYVAFAESAGGTGFRVNMPADLEPALDAALEEDGPTLLDVLTVPNIT